MILLGLFERLTGCGIVALESIEEETYGTQD
jgi:hypothetical protein